MENKLLCDCELANLLNGSPRMCFACTGKVHAMPDHTEYGDSGHGISGKVGHAELDDSFEKQSEQLAKVHDLEVEELDEQYANNYKKVIAKSSNPTVFYVSPPRFDSIEPYTKKLNGLIDILRGHGYEFDKPIYSLHDIPEGIKMKLPTKEPMTTETEEEAFKRVFKSTTTYDIVGEFQYDEAFELAKAYHNALSKTEVKPSKGDQLVKDLDWFLDDEAKTYRSSNNPTFVYYESFKQLKNDNKQNAVYCELEATKRWCKHQLEEKDKDIKEFEKAIIDNSDDFLRENQELRNTIEEQRKEIEDLLTIVDSYMKSKLIDFETNSKLTREQCTHDGNQVCPCCNELFKTQ